jgi:hypothetical protein
LYEFVPCLIADISRALTACLPDPINCVGKQPRIHHQQKKQRQRKEQAQTSTVTEPTYLPHKTIARTEFSVGQALAVALRQKLVHFRGKHVRV